MTTTYPEDFVKRFFGQIEEGLRAENLEPVVIRRIMNRLLYGHPGGPDVRHMFITAGVDAQKTVDDAIVKSREYQVDVHWHSLRDSCRPDYKHETYLNGERKEV